MNQQNAQNAENRRRPPRVTMEEQVTRAISRLSRNLLIHLIDEAEGVGCWDEADKDRLRSEVTRLHAAGKIASSDILDLA